ncbi:MAG: CBS domain-containing protein [Pseudomonadota bacterium]|nr:CBS domain-containing protein [Pseudomonadota bacterium]
MKTVREIMTPDPAICTPDSPIPELARLMVEFDCGAIPVVDSEDEPRPIGIVTDRDIVCRLVAEGLNPLDCDAADCMTTPGITVPVDSDVSAARDLLLRNHIRRLVVIDGNGFCCGMVSLADLVRETSDASVVRELSEPTEAASKVQENVKEPEPV